MNRQSARALARQVPVRLAELLGVPLDRVKSLERDPEADWEVETRAGRFLIEFKYLSDAATITLALHRIKPVAGGRRRNVIPLLAVPFMGEVGRRLCAASGIGWLDLSGNAHIHAPGVHVHVEGKSNAFKSAGRPSTAFAPLSSRIARWLLMHPKDRFTQQDLARATSVGKGFTSRIIRRLEALGLVARDEQGSVGVRDYDAMLEAWREAYHFSKHQIALGNVAARSGDEALRQLAAGFGKAGVTCAATGLAAAWLYTGFAAYRLVALYVQGPPEPELLKSLGFHEGAGGENVWLATPNDEGVFHGAMEREGIRCVHPVQVYMDLKRHPERSEEAAARLRQEWLGKDKRG